MGRSITAGAGVARRWIWADLSSRRVNLGVPDADEQSAGSPPSASAKDPMDPIRSIYEDDPDMMEIVREFVVDAPQRAEELEEHLHGGDFVSLQRLAHQLKGAGGGYGFDLITERATELEASLMNGADPATVKDRCGVLCETLRAVQVSEAS
jgi:HPt (histidine-containing phosphotransfer) domain-containing protein